MLEAGEISIGVAIPRDFDRRVVDNTRAAVHLLVDTRDAMGANLVNTICEAVAPRIAGICGGNVAMRILSNLADRSLVRAEVSIPVEELAGNEDLSRYIL